MALVVPLTIILPAGADGGLPIGVGTFEGSSTGYPRCCTYGQYDFTGVLKAGDRGYIGTFTITAPGFIDRSDPSNSPNPVELSGVDNRGIPIAGSCLPTFPPGRNWPLRSLPRSFSFLQLSCVATIDAGSTAAFTIRTEWLSYGSPLSDPLTFLICPLGLFPQGCSPDFGTYLVRP